jgi:DNA-binding LacI/PurR family transcriptional regulator
MREVAEAAGVSISTVSRVLNDKHSIQLTDDCRRRVREAAQDLGYRPNPYARALSRGVAPQIALVVRHTGDYVYNVVAWRLHTALQALGRQVAVTHVESLPAGVQPSEVLRHTAPEAAVFLYTWDASYLARVGEALHARDVRVLLVDCARPESSECPCDAVLVDRRRGSYAAVSHLIEAGHRSIGLITTSGAPGRTEGYERALAAHGIADRYMHRLEGGEAIPSAAAEGAQRLLREHSGISAIYCGYDLVALGAMRGLKGAGLRIPEDVSLVGFDDEPWAAHVSPSLTTVAYPVDELCEQAAGLLDRRLRGEDGPWERVTLTPALKVRESSGPGPHSHSS